MGVLAVLQSLLVAALAALAFAFMAVQLRRLALLVATGTAGDEVLTDAPQDTMKPEGDRRERRDQQQLQTAAPITVAATGPRRPDGLRSLRRARQPLMAAIA